MLGHVQYPIRCMYVPYCTYGVRYKHQGETGHACPAELGTPYILRYHRVNFRSFRDLPLIPSFSSMETRNGSFQVLSAFPVWSRVRRDPWVFWERTFLSQSRIRAWILGIVCVNLKRQLWNQSPFCCPQGRQAPFPKQLSLPLLPQPQRVQPNVDVIGWQSSILRFIWAN